MTTHRVEDIEAPLLECIEADVSIQTALERLFEVGQPQLGVTEDDELVGVVSHRDITRLLYLSDQMDQDDAILEKSVMMAVNRSFTRLSSDEELYTLFEPLAEAPYVIIEDGETLRVLRDVGLHEFLKEELQEFLLIEEIERTIRAIIRDTIEDDLERELEATFEQLDIPTPSGLTECSFRHYSIFISDNWDTFEDTFDHKQNFVRELINQVGDIRNQMFHFREMDEDRSMDTEFIEFAREHLEFIHDTMQSN